jgi:hypothetical protein
VFKNTCLSGSKFFLSLIHFNISFQLLEYVWATKEKVKTGYVRILNKTDELTEKGWVT